MIIGHSPQTVIAREGHSRSFLQLEQDGRKGERAKHSMLPLRVFLVENHEDTVRYIKMYLERLGHEVLVAGEMETALREIPGSGCDVLISDIGLPDGDGWQLMEKLGSCRPAFAIAISGYGTGNDKRKSHAAGYGYHLVKPFVPDALLTLLAKAADLKEKGSAPVIEADN
jgi:CheY-like chemotaxis protein